MHAYMRLSTTFNHRSPARSALRSVLWCIPTIKKRPNASMNEENDWVV